MEEGEQPFQKRFLIEETMPFENHQPQRRTSKNPWPVCEHSPNISPYRILKTE